MRFTTVAGLPSSLIVACFSATLISPFAIRKGNRISQNGSASLNRITTHFYPRSRESRCPMRNNYRFFSQSNSFPNSISNRCLQLPTCCCRSLWTFGARPPRCKLLRQQRRQLPLKYYIRRPRALRSPMPEQRNYPQQQLRSRRLHSSHPSNLCPYDCRHPFRSVHARQMDLVQR